MHPGGSLVTGAIAGVLFVKMFVYCQEKLQIDDVLGVWPLPVWPALGAALLGHFRHGSARRPWRRQPDVTNYGTCGCGFAAIAGAIVYGALKQTLGIR